MHLYRDLDKELWRDFVYQHPQGCIFHTPEMFQVFAKAKNYHPRLWTIMGSDQLPKLLFTPALVTLTDGVLRWATARAIAYGSLLYSPGDEAALELLLQAYQKNVGHRVMLTELRNLHNMHSMNKMLSRNGFVYEEHLNYLIDLNFTIPEIMQHIGSRTRKNIRRALRDKTVTVTVIEDKAELDVWYATLQKTYRHAHVPLADYSLFKAVFDELLPYDMAKFFLVRVGTTPAACSLELFYKDTVYGWYGGSDRTYGAQYVNELLMWHVLEWSAQHGYKIYDFGGAGKPDVAYGVRRFKAKFGGKLVAYGRHTYVHAPCRLGLSRIFYHLYRQCL